MNRNNMLNGQNPERDQDPKTDKDPCGAGGRLTAKQAYSLQRVGEGLLVDIRAPVELFHSGVADGAKNVTTESPKFVEHLMDELNGDKSKRVVLICATGKRSKDARLLLEKHGFTNVTDVSEGMLGNDQCGQGWVEEGLPTKSFA